MIGAIRITLNDNCWADLYLAGNYDKIEWLGEGYPSELGERYRTFNYKNPAGGMAGINIMHGLDEELVLRLKETKRYVVSVQFKDGNKTDEVFLPSLPNEGKFLACERNKDSVTFQFVNYLGRSRMKFPGFDFVVPFEVVPDKMNYEEDYIRLTEDLAERCSELLLDYSGSTSNVYSQSEHDPNTLLEQFIFLRQFCYGQNIQALVEAIKRNPDRILDHEEVMRPFGTGNPSERFFRNPLQNGKNWARITGSDSGQTVFVPQMIAVTRKFDSMDTPANRFIKFALQKFDQVCTNLIDALGGNNDLQVECAKEAKAIHEALDNIFHDAFFDEISELEMIPQNNQVLQKREGYSQIFAAYSMIDLALQLDWKGKDNIYEGESRNVALLYEYWLFFELFNIIRSIDGCVPVKTDEEPFIKTDSGITVALKEGETSRQYFEISTYGVKINLYYNRTFSPGRFESTRYQGSYSRPFRPDYTIAIFPDSYAGKMNGEDEAITRGAVSYIHFDAKYRITDLTSFFSHSFDPAAEEKEITDEKTDSVVNTYKRGDLLKMHTYNDAIRRTVGSYVLYPGSFDERKNEPFHLYDEILPGVGAFSLKPSIRTQGENVLKNFIISAIQSGSARDSRLNRVNYYTDMVLNEPSREHEQRVNAVPSTIKAGDQYVLGYIREKEYDFLSGNGLLKNDSEFYYYFYAIKEGNVYSHHRDLFKIPYFRFYKNDPLDDDYQIEPVLCRILSNELVSREILTGRLSETGFITTVEEHSAEYYYLLKVKVVDDSLNKKTIRRSDIDSQNGNDAFSFASPRIMNFEGSEEGWQMF